MPIYEYRRADGTTFEVLQSMTAEPLTRDPETGHPVERVLHAPALHFKGSGFYNTDYGTRKRQREKEASSSGEPSKNGKGDSESKSSASSDGGGSGSGDKAAASTTRSSD